MLLILVDQVKQDEINSNKYKNIYKSRNKIIKMSTRLKNRNLSNYRFANLFKFEKIQSTGTIVNSNSLTFNTKIVFIKLK